MNDELLECPFCGDIPDFPDGMGTQYEIECLCGMAKASVQIVDLMSIEERLNENNFMYSLRYKEEYIQRAKQEAIRMWNTRWQVLK